MCMNTKLLPDYVVTVTFHKIVIFITIIIIVVIILLFLGLLLITMFEV
jgi:hypothetical protein